MLVNGCECVLWLWGNEGKFEKYNFCVVGQVKKKLLFFIFVCVCKLLLVCIVVLGNGNLRN